MLSVVSVDRVVGLLMLELDAVVPVEAVLSVELKVEDGLVAVDCDVIVVDVLSVLDDTVDGVDGVDEVEALLGVCDETVDCVELEPVVTVDKVVLVEGVLLVDTVDEVSESVELVERVDEDNVVEVEKVLLDAVLDSTLTVNVPSTALNRSHALVALQIMPSVSWSPDKLPIHCGANHFINCSLTLPVKLHQVSSAYASMRV